MHFLRENERGHYRCTTRPIAAVRVKFETVDKARVLVMCGPDEGKSPLGVLRPDVRIAALPADVKILDPETRKPIKRSKQFWVTAETFDPYHMVIDTDNP